MSDVIDVWNWPGQIKTLSNYFRVPFFCALAPCRKKMEISEGCRGGMMRTKRSSFLNHTYFAIALTSSTDGHIGKRLLFLLPTNKLFSSA